MASLVEVVQYLDAELRTTEVPDSGGAVNGLQLGNRGEVTHVAAAVDFSSAAVRGAVDAAADLLLVHHGMFWGGATPFTGPAYDRLSQLVQAGIAVYSSHIPLDAHPVHGNNVLLAKALELTPTGGFAMLRGFPVGVQGESDLSTAALATKAGEFATRHGGALVATPFDPKRRTRRWGICTGAGASSETIREALDSGIDTLIVGEGPHHTAVQAIDHGLVILYAGHYATETLGVRSLAQHLNERFAIRATFIAAPTGL